MSIASSAAKLAEMLANRSLKIVFAESCTGGRVCGALTAVAGISQHLCGSFAVYRNESKAAWLGLPLDRLNDEGAVSAWVAKDLATAALQRTDEADIAVSVTGHLGPNAPAELDGVVFIGVAVRNDSANAFEINCSHLATRLQRQDWVIEQVLQRAMSAVV